MLASLDGADARTGWEQDGDAFADLAGRLAQSLRNAILCDLVTYPVRQREELVQLLKEHVTQHRIKVGVSRLV